MKRKKATRQLLLGPSSHEEDNQQHILISGEQAKRIDVVPRLMLPTRFVDERAAQMESAAIYPYLSYYDVSFFTLGDQTTWMLPSVRSMQKSHELEVHEGNENYLSFMRNLVKNSGIYALSSLAAPFVSLILSPFLTHSLSHDDYGALAVLNTAIALIAGITQLGLSASFFRSYNYDSESEGDRRELLSTAVILVSLVSTIVAIVAIEGAPWLASLLLGSASFADSIKIAGLVVLLQNLTIPGFSWLRAENRVTFFATLSFISLLVNTGATILLVGTFRMGIDGSLIATGCGYASGVIATLPLILLRSRLHFRLDLAWGLLAFGLPHVVNLVSGWVLQLSDRYLLGRLGSLPQAASYAVAYSLGGVLSSLIISPFSLAWFPSMFSIAKKENAPSIFRLVFRWYAMSLLFATFILSLFGSSVLDLFFPPVYRTAAPVIPVIALSTAFSGLYVMVSMGISIQRKPWLTTVFTTISALLNIGLNVILVPVYGAMGAAVATLAAYIVFASVAHLVSQRLYPVSFEVGRLFMALFIGVALYAGSCLLTQLWGTLSVWSVYLSASGLYGGFLLLLTTPTSRAENHTRR